MVDALPYMVDYPYGCTEQTLEPLPADGHYAKGPAGHELDLKDIEKKRTNLNAQEIGNDADRAKQWERLKDGPP